MLQAASTAVSADRADRTELVDVAAMASFVHFSLLLLLAGSLCLTTSADSTYGEWRLPHWRLDSLEAARSWTARSGMPCYSHL
jgi:hypothetical protein